jgi:uncharacterized protein YdhG (YjbR/CyaY superfamily)
MPRPTTVDAYIDAAPPPSQGTLRELRSLVLEVVPGVTERISYGMPTYDHRGRRLLHLSAAKRHVAVYALVHEDSEVPEALSSNLHERSTLSFGFGQPLPIAALREAIRHKAETLDRG